MRKPALQICFGISAGPVFCIFENKQEQIWYHMK